MTGASERVQKPQGDRSFCPAYQGERRATEGERWRASSRLWNGTRHQTSGNVIVDKARRGVGSEVRLFFFGKRGSLLHRRLAEQGGKESYVASVYATSCCCHAVQTRMHARFNASLSTSWNRVDGGLHLKGLGRGSTQQPMVVDCDQLTLYSGALLRDGMLFSRARLGRATRERKRESSWI